MKKYKICVYTIAKNEEENVNKWVDSMSEADYICVLDTGSTDKTVELLRARDVIVEVKEIKPWRFDIARNESMKLIPKDTDICVSTDLDEVFEPGWAEILRKNWKDEYLMARYWYIFQHTPSGGQGDSFFRDKIHKNDPMFYWQFPIHEVLWRPEDLKERMFPNIILHHWQNTKTDRKSYLNLLELEYSENPKNSRNLFLLGREYYIYKDWKNCIEKLEEYIKIGPRKIIYEKAFALNLIGYCYLELRKINDAIFSFQRSLNLFKLFRMTYMGLAHCYFIIGDFNKSLYYIDEGLKIKDRFGLFSDEGASWEEKPHLLKFENYIKLDRIEKALLELEEIEKYGFDMKEQKNKIMELLN